MNERLRIAIYIRVSTEDQAKEGYPPLICSFRSQIKTRGTGSLEVQREHLESFAKREGAEILRPAVCILQKSLRHFCRPARTRLLRSQDDGISGYSIERPALKKLLMGAKA